MTSRRAFLLTLTSGVMALAVLAAPVIADELIGVITKVDVSAKKLTVFEKGTKNEVEVTVTDDTDFVSKKGTRKVDLERLAKGVKKQQDAGKKGMHVVVTHDKGVASKIAPAKKKEAPKDDDKPKDDK